MPTPAAPRSSDSASASAAAAPPPSSSAPSKPTWRAPAASRTPATRPPPSSRTRAGRAARPATQARVRPPPQLLRPRTTSSAPAGSRSASAPTSGSPKSPWGRSNTPSTQAPWAPGRTTCAFALPPINKSSECASTVFPAPVSPVIAFSPSPTRNSAFSSSRRFSILNSRSMHAVYQYERTDSPRFRLGRSRFGYGLSGLHEVAGADEDEAEGGAHEGENGGDQDDLVEAADEGDFRGVDDVGPLTGRRHRCRGSRAAGRDEVAEATRSVRQQLGQLRVDSRLEDRAEAGHPSGEPGLAES